MLGLARGEGEVDVTEGANGEGAVWTRACAALRGELGDAAFGSYLAPAHLRRRQAGGLVLVTPTGFARDWLRRNCWPRVKEVWGQHDPQRRALDLRSRQEFESEEGVSAPQPARVAAAPTPAPVASTPVLRLAALEGASVPVREGAEPSRAAGVLQARHTFASFVASPTNEFALSVARQVAGWSAQAFNPVVFHSAYGFGKTHLLSAIAHEAQAQRPEARVLYMTGDGFVSAFVRAVMERTGPAFKDELRRADLLLIDDIHILGGKKGSQEELFHTLASLMGEGKRVVVSADRPPSALTEVDPRLRSHLCAGLVCGIENADAGLRLRFAETRFKALGDQLGFDGRARGEVLQLLADRFPGSIRELEGGINTIVARASGRLPELKADEAATLLRPHLKGGERKVTVDEIQKLVCEHYGLKQADLLSPKRTRAIARPRQVAMSLAKALTTRSYPDIGRRFGNRDHTTVLHAVRQIEKLRAEDASLAADVETLTRRLRE